MKVSTTLIVLVVLVFGTSQADQQEYAKNEIVEANARYKELVERIKVTASTDDIEELRKVYVKTDFYDPYGMDVHDMEMSMKAGMNEEDWEKCLEHATMILDMNFTSLIGHYRAMNCARNSGETVRGDFHRKVWMGLIYTIMKTGDGKSEETAFVATGSREVLSFIKTQGFLVKGQSLAMGENGRMYDIMKVIDEDGREFEWYFDIDKQMEELGALVDSLTVEPDR